MSDARTVILQAIRSNWVKNDTSPVSEVDAILAALAEAGLVIVPKVITDPIRRKMQKEFEAGCSYGDIYSAALEAANEQ